MTRKTTFVPVVALVALLVAATGCLEDKTLQVVFKGETCAEFVEDHDSETFTTTEVVDYAKEINDILEDNGYSRESLVSAKLVSVSYGVTDFKSPGHDWAITGAITVRRLDTGAGGTQTIVNYSKVSVQDAVGKRIIADLDPGGVDLLNTALQDFLDGQDPVLEFAVVNGDVDPNPTPIDRLVFEWKAWLVLQVILDETVEDVPDPF